MTNPYDTWMNRPKAQAPSTSSMVASCIANAEDAARKEAEARALYQRLTEGDPRLHQARCDIRRYVWEQKHWREYAAYHRGKPGPLVAVPATAPGPDRRLPPERDEDDLLF